MGSNTRRWMIVATLFVAIVCNYLDRQLLSVLKPEILQHFGIGNLEYAWIVNVFLVCYAVMYPVSGLLVDRFGPFRRVFGFLGSWGSYLFVGHPIARLVAKSVHPGTLSIGYEFLLYLVLLVGVVIVYRIIHQKVLSFIKS